MSLRAAVSTFSIVPVGRAEVRASLLAWLPLVGGALGALAGLVFAALVSINDKTVLLAAFLAVGALALLTRGLHLDGLADTADGLGSRTPSDQALEIMRRSDIGPFGVVTLVIVLGVDVAALTSVTGKWHVLAALAVAATTARLSVVHAALRGVPSARPSGFGSLVAGTVRRPLAAAETVLVLGFGAGAAALCDINPLRWVAVQAVALMLVYAFRVHTTRRLGGVTGDVFGALIEVGTAVTLVGLALFS